MKRELLTTFAAAFAVTGSASAATFAIEAETATFTNGTASFVKYNDDSNASGGEYIAATGSSSSKDALATFTLNVPEDGTYYAYVRYFTNNSGADSFYMPADTAAELSGATDPSREMNSLNNSVTTPAVYRWINTSDRSLYNGTGPDNGSSFDNPQTAPAPAYVFTTGSQVFTIRSRETNLRIDAIVFTTDDNADVQDLEAALVPEPGSLALLGLGGLLIAARRRR